MHLGIYTDAHVRGGAESALANFIERYDPQWTVTVMGPDEELLRWLASHRAGAAVAVLPEIRDRTDVGAMWATRRAFTKLAPDVIHFNLSTMSSCQWAILAALSIPGQRYVVMEHSPVGTWSSLSQRLKRITSKRADAHVTVGHAAARNIEALGGLPDGSIDVIHSGVPVVELEPVDRDDEAFTVGMLARHDPAKGIDIAIRAIAVLGDGFRLVVVGDGPQTEELVELIEQLGVGDLVELRGYEADARRFYPGFDVYLLPSRFEAFPVTVQEAMQAGVPVVATEVGSIREAIDDGETGLIVPVGDVGALAAAIRRLAGDPDLRDAMGTRAAEVGVERFDVDAAVRDWESLYRRVVSRA